MMLQATDDLPTNFGFLGKGNTAKPKSIAEQIRGGAVRFKLHEDWGTTLASIDCCLSIAEDHDVQLAIYTDTLNESGFVEASITAFRGRTIRTYHCSASPQSGLLTGESPHGSWPSSRQ